MHNALNNALMHIMHCKFELFILIRLYGLFFYFYRQNIIVFND